MTSITNLTEVYYDNIRDNQIGGQTDGISEEVARDIGYLPLEGPQETAEVLSPKQKKIAKIAGQLICGDCGQVVPCQHTDGKGRTFGY